MHFFEYVLFSKTIPKSFCSEIRKEEVWERKNRQSFEFPV